jgi:hypothetical protein
MVFKEGKLDTSRTKINHSEQIYGQSFIFVSGIPLSQLPSILQQLAIMHPFIDTETSNYELPVLTKDESNALQISYLHLSEEPYISHISKSPKNHIDIFSNEIQPKYKGTWNCETWIRGHHCEPCENVKDNKTITYLDTHYSSSQDHSKYACNNDQYIYIGDLNRMTSQFHRGGGGFILKDAKLAGYLYWIMDK